MDDLQEYTDVCPRRRITLTTIVRHRFKILICTVILLLLIIILIICLTVPGRVSTIYVITDDAVGQIGESVILSCTFIPDATQSSNILWEKVGDPGAVYRYENGEVSLADQNPKFSGRTSLFLDQVSAGNASLSLNNLQMTDAGDYKCTITNSIGKIENKLSLTVGVFTTLVITNITQTTLRCSSSSWYPRPSVSWLNASSGADLTRFSNTTYVSGLSGIITIISDFKEAEQDEHYLCVIRNNHVCVEGEAVITASGLQTSVYQQVTISAADIVSPSLLLLCLLFLLRHLGIW